MPPGCQGSGFATAATGVLVPLWRSDEKTGIRPVTVPSLLGRTLAKGINKKWGLAAGKSLAPLQVGASDRACDDAAEAEAGGES